MRRRLASTLVVALVLAAGAATADDADAVRLRLLPKKLKGITERIVLEAQVGWPEGAGSRTDEIKATLRRKIKTVDEDGLPKKEELAVESGEYSETSASPDGSSSMTTSTLEGFVATVGRSSRSRLATGELGDAGTTVSPKLLRILRRDPDGLARALEPEAKVANGDEWDVDAEELLILYGPPRAKLVEEGSKAKAFLESLKEKDGVREAHVTLKAKIKFVTPDDPDEPGTLRIEASVRGPADGSAFPRKESVTVQSRSSDGKKEAQSVTLERSIPEDEEEEKKD